MFHGKAQLLGSEDNNVQNPADSTDCTVLVMMLSVDRFCWAPVVLEFAAGRCTSSITQMSTKRPSI